MALPTVAAKGSPGVYWQGANGNFYIRGNDTHGVQDIGSKLPEATESTFTQIADPNPPSPAASPTDTTDASSGSSSSSYTNPAAVALYNQLASSYENEAGQLEKQIPTLTKNIDNAYNTAVSEENQSKGNQENQNQEQRQTTIGGINQDTNTNYNALMALLGASGAAVSSAARVNAPQAISQVASGQVSSEDSTYNQNENSITESYKNALQDLLSQKNSNLSNALSGVKQSEQTDIQAAEAATSNAAQYGDESTAQAHAAVAPLIARANDVQSQLNAIFGKYAAPAYTAPAAPSLTSYATPTTAAISTEKANPTTPSTFLPYLTNLNQGNVLTGSNSTPAPTGATK